MGHISVFQLNDPKSMNFFITSESFALAVEAETKRQLRLLKNKEAQKISRKKKNHYIRCLEDRVGKYKIFLSNR